MNIHRILAVQKGVVLVIALIILVLLTLFGIAVVNMSGVNLRAMGNAQSRAEAITAAQQAVEQVASTNFAANPQPVTVNIDINGDGTNEYTVAVAKPTCLSTIPIRLPGPGVTSELNSANPDDQGCFGSISVSNPGIAGGGGGGNSSCSNTQWDLTATVTDNTGNNAALTLHQGVGSRVGPSAPPC